MKSTIVALLMGLLSGQALAEFKNVNEILCDGVQVGSDKVNISRVFVDMNRSIFGVGSLQAVNETECREVDFYSVLVSAASTVNGVNQSTFEVVSPIGKRSSCTGSEITPIALPDFEVGFVSDSKVILNGANGCHELELIL
jgi:hypothetical protein